MSEPTICVHSSIRKLHAAHYLLYARINSVHAYITLQDSAERVRGLFLSSPAYCSLHARYLGRYVHAIARTVARAGCWLDSVRYNCRLLSILLVGIVYPKGVEQNHLLIYLERIDKLVLCKIPLFLLYLLLSQVWRKLSAHWLGDGDQYLQIYSVPTVESREGSSLGRQESNDPKLSPQAERKDPSPPVPCPLALGLPWWGIGWTVRMRTYRSDHGCALHVPYATS